MTKETTTTVSGIHHAYLNECSNRLNTLSKLDKRLAIIEAGQQYAAIIQLLMFQIKCVVPLMDDTDVHGFMDSLTKDLLRNIEVLEEKEKSPEVVH